MKRFYFIFFLLWIFVSSFTQTSLEIKDINKWMVRLFDYHIEQKSFSILQVRRFVKIYLEQFDKDKIYLMEAEVLPFLNMKDEQIQEVVLRLQREDYSDFVQINQQIVKAIDRARKYREEIKKEIITNDVEGRKGTKNEWTSYAKTPEELFFRQKEEIATIFENHKKKTQMESRERRAKAFQMIDTKMTRREHFYVQEDPHQFSLHILKAFAKSLDAHTAFFSADEAFEMRMSLEKQFEGLGVILTESIDGAIVSDLIKGSPAANCGKIKIHDVIAEIDGKDVTNLSFEEILEKLKKNKEDVITLGLTRFSYEQQKYLPVWHVSLKLEAINMEQEKIQYSYEPFGNGIIGKIVLPSFYENANGCTCEGDLKRAIDELRKKGKLLGLLIDLRENSGGFLNQAVRVVSLFISSGIIVVSKYSHESRVLRSTEEKPYFSGPLLLLTSKLSASASEIVAQALQDYGVALIVGDERTFGKGTIQYQTVTNEKAEAFFKVTVGKYYTVSGKSTQIEGVKADVVLPTEFSIYHLGERFLEYPLAADQISPLYKDSLQDLDSKTRHWFEKNYLPHLQRYFSFWHKRSLLLQKNSSYRQEKDCNFQIFLKNQEELRAGIVQKNDRPNYGMENLQTQEGVQILKDMILLEVQSRDKK